MKTFKFFIYLLFGLLIISCSVSSKNEEVVAIKAFNNLYVTVPGDTSCVKLIANSSEVSDWEKFNLVHTADEKTVLFKANTNCFVCANYIIGGFLTADKRNASSWESFILEDLGNNQVAIKASNGKYVTSDQTLGGLLIANRDTAGDWEKFTLVKQ